MNNLIIGYYPGGGGNRYYEYLYDRSFTEPGVAYDFRTENIISRKLYFESGSAPPQFDESSVLRVLSHCVNYYRIKEFLPFANTDNTIIINSDLKSSLRREWSIKGKYKPMFSSNSRSRETIVLSVYNSIRATHWPIIENFLQYNSLSDKIKTEVELTINDNKMYTEDNTDYSYLNASYTAIHWHHELYKQFPVDPGPAKFIDIKNDNDKFSKFMREELSRYEDNALFNFAWDIYTEHGKDAPIISIYDKLLNDKQK